MRSYTDELKAQVIAEWLAGSSLGSLVKAHGIPKTTVQGWASEHPRPRTVPKKIGQVYDLDAMALKLIDGSVSAVSSIHGLASNDAWLQRQNAADVAILLGVISDKLYRLLGAIRPPRPLLSSAAEDSAGEEESR